MILALVLFLFTPQAQPAPSSQASLVGTWRNATGYAKFNADGTGEMDGEKGRWSVSGNQLTLTGTQGTMTVPFVVRGDTMVWTVNGVQISMTRVKEVAGAGSVRPEMVGKWCYVSVVNAQQGARLSDLCFTLAADGRYTYTGETSSSNPYGGTASQSSDAGTWTATETTLTATSRTKGVTVFKLEKRNHPKNNDPMLVLDGQAFVTYFKKAPWS